MAGPLHIRCPDCGQYLPAPAEVVGDVDGHSVTVRVDRSQLYGHRERCTAAGRDERTQPRQLAQRSPLQLSDLGALLVRGPRACTMCGTTNDACGELLRRRQPCCAACGDGNTHPTAAEQTPCAEWGAEHGAS